MDTSNFQRIRISIIFLISSIGFIFYNYLVELHPMTTVGILQTLYIWTLISLLPAILPLISCSILIRRITLILGVIIKIIESAVSLIYLFDSANEFYKLFGMTMILFFGVIGLLGMIYTYRWLQVKVE